MCFVGDHVWAGDKFNAFGMLDDGERCCCGEITWREYRSMLHNKDTGAGDDTGANT
jgi:hypothetical protein